LKRELKVLEIVEREAIAARCLYARDQAVDSLSGKEVRMLAAYLASITAGISSFF